jgi:hypothetical protein
MVELKDLAQNNKILLPPKVTKSEIVDLLIENNISRSTKRKISSKDEVATKKSKNSKLMNLILKQKNDLGEKLELGVKKHTLPSQYLINDDLLIRNETIVGKIKDGMVIKLDENDVQYAIGERIQFDPLKIVGQGCDVDVKLDNTSDEEEE